MSVRIVLDSSPDYYTNLDYISGRVILRLDRPEPISAILVKLEGQSRSLEPFDASEYPSSGDPTPGTWPGASSSSSSTPGIRRLGSSLSRSGAQPPALKEDHKVLYQVVQVFPEPTAYGPGPFVLGAGEHEYRFGFQIPLTNSCAANQKAAARVGVGIPGLSAAGADALVKPAQSIRDLLSGGIRAIEGGSGISRVEHVTHALPPSLLGTHRAEIKYYVKTTVKRPGILRESWRHSVGFRFLPTEPSRPSLPSNKESFARRPFSFSAAPAPEDDLRGSLMDGFRKRSSTSSNKNGSGAGTAPSVVISARLPHPPILTCGRPIPLRLLAAKSSDSSDQVYLASLQVELIATTLTRCYSANRAAETNVWVVVSRPGLCLPLTQGRNAAIESEVEVDNAVWKHVSLPEGVVPTFTTCNISRSYSLEIKLGVTWGRPSSGRQQTQPPTMFLPLVFRDVEVLSGVERRGSQQQQQPGAPLQQPTQCRPFSPCDKPTPPLPPRRGSQQQKQQQSEEEGEERGNRRQGVPQDASGQPPYDDAPPSYDEAMREMMTGPVIGAQGAGSSAQGADAKG